MHMNAGLMGSQVLIWSLLVVDAAFLAESLPSVLTIPFFTLVLCRDRAILNLAFGGERGFKILSLNTHNITSWRHRHT